MKSVMQNHSFSQVPQADIQRSKFNRSHGLKTTMDADVLVPILVDEVLPGDTHTLRLNAFGRLATPINPVMDNAYLETFFFFIPMRLLWNSTEKFFGEQQNPDSSTDFLIPNAARTAITGSLDDYFGLPLGKTVNANILPHRAYFLIWDEWFRDQNLQESYNISKADSGNPIYTNTTTYPSNVTLAKRGKRHDYFTSCLPFAQKGETVQVPLGTKAFVTGDGSIGADAANIQTSVGSFNRLAVSGSSIFGTGASVSENDGTLYADLSTATAATINEWRTAFQVQKFLERDARGGTRYIEKIKSHFGVTNPDFRLQRPEYLGGTSDALNIHPVPQTNSTDSTTPQGNLAAFGTVSTNGGGFTKSFTEHGYIIGLANVRADLTYQQGLDKLWSRRTQYDHYFPTFAHLGEQAVLNKEIFVTGTPAIDDGIFGYQERYAEYRYKKSQLTGLFRSDASASLDAWHLSQDFASTPTLNSAFIESNTPFDRVIAVPSEPHIILDCYFDYTSVRPMPVNAPPGMIDHF